MSRAEIKVDKLIGGLNTRAPQFGLPLSQFIEAKNVRFNSGSPARRLGRVKIATINPTVLDPNGALELSPTLTPGEGFGGTEDTYVRVPIRPSIHKLPIRFTLDITVMPNDIPESTISDAQIVGFDDTQNDGGINPWSLEYTSDQTFRFSITLPVTGIGNVTYQVESTSAFATGSIWNIRVMRVREILYLIINNVIEGQLELPVSGSESSVEPSSADHGYLYFGAGTIGSNPTQTNELSAFSGVIDEFRLFHTSFPMYQRHANVEWVDARYPSLVTWYRFSAENVLNSDDSKFGKLILDESRFAQHGEIIGSNYEFVTGLVMDCAPVAVVHHYQSVDGFSKLLTTGGERFYVGGM